MIYGIKVDWTPPYKKLPNTPELFSPYYIKYWKVKSNIPEYWDMNSIITAYLCYNLQDSEPQILKLHEDNLQEYAKSIIKEIIKEMYHI